MSTNKKISIKKFVENIGDLSNISFQDEVKLSSKQQYILSKWANNRLNVCVHSRQTGGSLLGILYALYDLFINKHNVIFLCNKQSNCEQILETILRIIEKSPYLKSTPILKLLKKTDSYIEFNNGARINILSMRKTYICGILAHTLIIDNIDYAPNSEEFFEAVIPIIIGSTQNKLIMYGTPKDKNSLLNTLYENPDNTCSKTKILWNEVFNRDAEWKTEMMQMFGWSCDKKLAQSIWNKEYALKY